jgi:ABC-type transporter Mla maintaining outer membrane lipid asymmetry ATPase subunit MlaF
MYLSIYGATRALQLAKHVLIELRNIHKSFGRQRVLDGISLNIDKSEGLVIIIGASGQRQERAAEAHRWPAQADEGEVWFDGQRIDNLPESELMKVRDALRLPLPDGRAVRTR